MTGSTRRRRRLAALTRPEPNLTPLLDVVLQLIVFFLILVHFGTRIEGARDDLRLPVAPAALPTVEVPSSRLVVGLDAEGRLITGEPPLTILPESIEPWWAAEAQRRREAATAAPDATLVLVRADRAARYGAIRRLLAAAQAHGFVRFSLVVQRERP